MGNISHYISILRSLFCSQDLGVDIERLARLIKKPLRPLWLTPQSSLDQAIDTSAFYPVICVSASEFIQGGCQARPNGFLYVQGSADDQEAWSMVTQTISTFLEMH